MVWQAGLKDAQGLLNDGTTGTDDPSLQTGCCNASSAAGGYPRCVNNKKPTYSYNQGMYLGACAALWQLQRNHTYIDAAVAVLDASIEFLTNNKVLTEVIKPPQLQNRSCSRWFDPAGSDIFSFKGVYMVQLARLLQTAHSALPAAKVPYIPKLVTTMYLWIYTHRHACVVCVRVCVCACVCIAFNMHACMHVCMHA